MWIYLFSAKEPENPLDAPSGVNTWSDVLCVLLCCMCRSGHDAVMKESFDKGPPLLVFSSFIFAGWDLLGLTKWPDMLHVTQFSVVIQCS